MRPEPFFARIGTQMPNSGGYADVSFKSSTLRKATAKESKGWRAEKHLTPNADVRDGC